MAPPARSHDQGHEDEAISIFVSRFGEASHHKERIRIPGSWEEKIEDVRKEMTTRREALKGRTPTSIDELI